MKYISYIEVVVGIGLGLGPLLGSAVYPYLDYEGTMYLFGCLNLSGVLLCVALIPSELNTTLSSEEFSQIVSSEKKKDCPAAKKIG